MVRPLYAWVATAIVSVAMPLRAANKPRAGRGNQNAVWTNDDFASLRVAGLICIVGQTNEEASKSESLAKTYLKTRDAAWYAEQAAKLRDELERRRAQLTECREALEDARGLKETTSGINLDEGDIAITPQAGIEILQGRGGEEQAKLDALEDLARRHDIPAGTQRGQ